MAIAFNDQELNPSLTQDEFEALYGNEPAESFGNSAQDEFSSYEQFENERSMTEEESDALYKEQQVLAPEENNEPVSTSDSFGPSARGTQFQKERDALYARLNERQRQAVSAPKDHSVLILAGAGSGKTSVITARIAKLIDNEMPSNEILAVTFTNKSSEEMKSRLKKLMDRRSVTGIMVGTFHSLCSKMLRDNYAAAGLPKSFAILDTDGQEAICRGVLKDLGLTKASSKAKNKEESTESTGLFSLSSKVKKAGGVAENEVESDDNFVKPAQCAKYISKRKEAGFGPEPTTDITTSSTDTEQMECVFMHYQKICTDAGLLDFQDLLSKTVHMLENNEFVRNIYRNRFSSIMIDEFQDTNDIQYRWLELVKGPKACVMAVGDDYQSIYAFRGANPKNMFRFLAEMATDALAPEGRIIKLEQNYRSLPHILEAANKVISKNTGQMEKTLFTTQPDRHEKIDLVTFGGGNYEAKYIAKGIHSLIKEGKCEPNEIAVLYRTNQQSRSIEQELNKLGISLTVYGGFRFFERQEVKLVLAYMDLVSNMTRDLSFAKVANMPPRGIGERTIEELRQAARENNLSMMEMIIKRNEYPESIGNLAAKKKHQKLAELCSDIMDISEISMTQPLNKVIIAIIEKFKINEHYLSEAVGTEESILEAKARVANISELVSAATQFEQENDHLSDAIEQLPEYLAHVALMTSTSESSMDQKNTVSLMTVHSSKGLEFDHVFIAGLDEEIFPHNRAIQSDLDNAVSNNQSRKIASQIEKEGRNSKNTIDEVDGEGIQEERRLMYVAMTRARKTLTLTTSTERMIFNENKVSFPSRFLNEIPPHRLNRIDDRQNVHERFKRPERVVDESQFYDGSSSPTPIKQPSTLGVDSQERISNPYQSRAAYCASKPATTYPSSGGRFRNISANPGAELAVSSRSRPHLPGGEPALMTLMNSQNAKKAEDKIYSNSYRSDQQR